MELIMEEIKRIGLFGSVINNGNLGCQALAYSIIDLLEEISVNNSIPFEYIDFEFEPDDKKTTEFKNRLNLKSNIISVYTGNYYDFLRKIKHYKENQVMKVTLNKCDLVFDLTEGDSFSDIYGDFRFASWTAIKEVVEKTGVPFFLGSQTYGPFNKKENELRAAEVIKKASAVFARDKISADYVKKISGVDPILTCDLAFRLPYKKRERISGQCKKVGFNVSGLLTSDGTEGAGTDKAFSLATDYDKFVDSVLSYLINNQYEVHLIGHVEADYTANKKLKERYPQVILAPEFDNPIDAKSYISAMDLFIGSRMHATIAALTSNTPVVPVAYSRKFIGLFANVNYPYVIDLQKLKTGVAVNAVVDRIKNYHDTKIATNKSYEIAMKENEECYKVYEKVVLDLLKR